jgi:hypothetical protein
MRKAAFATLFLVLLISLPRAAQAAGDGNAILPNCAAQVRAMDAPEGTSSWSDVSHGNYCLGMVRGVDGVDIDIAAPKDVTLGQLVRVVLLYMQTHPEELHKPDFVLVHEALHKAFPAK